MSIKDRLIQFVLRGKDELSPEAKKSAEALAAVSAEAEELGKVLDSAKDARGLAKGLETTQRAAERAERGLVQADLQVKELRDALSKAPGSAGLEQSLKDAEREARRMERGLDKLRESLADQEKAARAAGIDTNKLADEEKRLAAEVEKAKTALDANSQQLKVLQREHAAAGRAAAEQATKVDGAREAMSRGAKQVLAFAAAYISLSAAFGLVQRGLNLVRDGIYSMLQTGDQFELLDKRLASLMGSIAGGEQATKWIKQFAKDTPLEVADVTEAFALLKTYGLDPMDGTLQAVVDKNEELGGGMERLTGIASALGQAYGKQKLQTEEILQLVERGVPAWDMLEKITGKNAAQLTKLATEGRLGRDVIKALIAEIGKSSEGAAADAMGTLTGKVSNLKDVWSDFQDRVADSGALDFAKRKLGEVAAKIDEMDKDGRLDKLAESLSNAFIQGAEKAEEFALKLLDVDFNRLTDDSTRWLNEFGAKLDSAARSVTLVTAPVRALTNIVTGGIAAIGVVSGALFGTTLKALSQVAKLLPKAFGGDEVVRGLESASAAAYRLMSAAAEQVKQDGLDIAATWASVAAAAEQSAERQSAAQLRAIEKTKSTMAQNGADIASFFRQNIATVEQALAAIAFAETAQDLKEIETALSLTVLATDDLAVAMTALAQKRGFVEAGDAVVTTAEAAQVALTDMASALQLIDTAKSVQQLEVLRDALLKAYQDGRISQEQYAQASSMLNGKLADIGKTAKAAGDGVSDLSDKLGDLASVQSAISNAKTDVDINNIRTALRKLYEGGTITAAQYNDELKKTSDRQKELKTAVEQGKKAQDDKNDSDREAITTSEQLRRESGKRMEAERKAGDQAMQDRRRGSEETKRDVSAFEDYFGGVVSRARQPLAAMSAAALEFYDRLRGISSVDVSIDTGSLDATRESLERVTRALSDVQAEAAKPMISALGRWQLETQQASLKTQQAFLGQKAALQDLTETYARNDISAEQFVRRASSMRRALSLLDDSDLSGLESAISAAQQRMEQMNQSTRGTLEGLMDELDGLQGRTEEIERRKFAARQRELQLQLAEAQSGGDSQAVANAQRALGMLRQIEAETAQQRQRTEQEKRIEANKQAATPAPAAAATPSKIIRLELKGKSVDVAVNSAGDETKLLGILEDAALRAL